MNADIAPLASCHRSTAGLIGSVCLAVLLLLAAPPAAQAVDACPPYRSPHERFGFNVVINHGKDVDDYAVNQLHAGWFLDYTFRVAPNETDNLHYLHTVSSLNIVMDNLTNTLGLAVDSNPGDTWIVGNEPDRFGQDGLTPIEYAKFYHTIHTFIKQRDPTALVAVGAIVQPTPIRLRYLNMVLEAYRTAYGGKLPADIWTVHGFILREDASWGASIPPGLEDYAHEGMLYSIGDHINVSLLKEFMVTFREWLAANGYRDKPLLLTEFGILLPDIYEFYDFSDPRIRTFMYTAFDFLLSATDADTGYAPDDNRLLQGWAWYSLNDRDYDMETELGFNGNLFDHDSGLITQTGVDFGAYASNQLLFFADPSVDSIQIVPDQMDATTVETTLSITVEIANLGNLDSTDVIVDLWFNSPDGEKLLIGQESVLDSLSGDCIPVPVQFEWAPGPLPLAIHTISAEVHSLGGPTDADLTNNTNVDSFFVGPPEAFSHVYIPLIAR